MRLDTLNLSSLLPAQSTETGAAAVPQNPIPFQTVTPTQNLPQDGNRPEDKDPKNKNPYENPEVDEERSDLSNPLPEQFLLIMAPNFADLLKSYMKDETLPLVSVRREQREQNGMKANHIYSNPYAQMEKHFDEREKNHEEVLMYHYRRPGQRFKGAI
jgi:hypothetical protein